VAKGRRTKLLKQNGRKSRIWLLVVKVGKRNNHRAVVQVEEPQLYHIEYIVSPEKCRLRLRGNNNSNTYLEPTEPEVKGYTYVRTSPSFFFLFLDRGAQPEIETKQSAMRSKGCVVNFIYPENSLSLSVQDLRISGPRDLLPAALHIWQKFEPLHCTPFRFILS